VRGEFFKVFRQWTTWILLVLLLGVIILPYIIEFTVPNVKTNIQTDSLHFFYNILSVGLSIVRVFTGMFLLIVAARVVGLEYQLGTIRVLLSRGVGRLQLLFAKILTVTIIALILLVIGLVLNYLLTLLLVAVVTGNLNAYSALNSQFWLDAWTFVLTILFIALNDWEPARESTLTWLRIEDFRVEFGADREQGQRHRKEDCTRVVQYDFQSFGARLSHAVANIVE